MTEKKIVGYSFMIDVCVCVCLCVRACVCVCETSEKDVAPTGWGKRMECSWKTVLLLVCASLGVQYTAIRTLRDSLSGPCQGVYQCQSRHHRESNWRTLCDDSWMSMESPQKHILLFATTRSGSSFTGGNGEALELPEESWCTKKCGNLNLTLASRACLSRSHVAIKTVRIPKVSDLRTLVEDPRLDLKIIHLVRDPRAILASRITAFSDQFRAWKIWNATGRQPRYVDLSQITSTCQDMVASAEAGLARPAWLKGRYLLVRYEDLAFNPKDMADKIYQFIGLELEDRVQTWIRRNTNSNVFAPFDWNYKYSTTRDSRMTAASWRLRLDHNIVRTVQNLCNDTLALLGYKLVHSTVQLRNLSHSLVEPNPFQPNLSQNWVTTKNGQGGT
ncbi:carbohydrate sulfotransferase 1-like isoform X3 [Syngnathus typhle]|uniref:carbohydrate sulfotransferase 1-like isoform X3 n=1 Tax=Syngnathus typhle TaxID=161592 RepID=UPI002A6AED6E|nr:carbohydrate sulfotransferase 1-like isoform X3 [Syngnathus typhle]